MHIQSALTFLLQLAAVLAFITIAFSRCAFLYFPIRPIVFDVPAAPRSAFCSDKGLSLPCGLAFSTTKLCGVFFITPCTMTAIYLSAHVARFFGRATSPRFIVDTCFVFRSPEAGALNVAKIISTASCIVWASKKIFAALLARDLNVFVSLLRDSAMLRCACSIAKKVFADLQFIRNYGYVVSTVSTLYLYALPGNRRDITDIVQRAIYSLACSVAKLLWRFCNTRRRAIQNRTALTTRYLHINTPLIFAYYTPFGIKTPQTTSCVIYSPEATEPTPHRPDGAKAMDERARRLLLAIELAQLEDDA